MVIVGIYIVKYIPSTSITTLEQALLLFTKHDVWQYKKRLHQLDYKTVKLEDISNMYYGYHDMRLQGILYCKITV